VSKDAHLYMAATLFVRNHWLSTSIANEAETSIRYSNT
jgi:hypothetical protein